MKQEATKKSKLWLWIVIAVAALAVAAGVVLAIVLPGAGQQDAQTHGTGDLYWNVDRYQSIEAETGLSTREPGEDGLYHIRFVLDGEIVELAVANDKQLVNYIDMLDVMGLAMDADGVVTDVVDPKTFTTELAKDFLVKKMDGDQLVLNSSPAMNGMESTLTITENTGIYNVCQGTENPGAPDQCKPLDKVIVFGSDSVATHVFITERAEPAGVYWRVERKFSDGQTTRKPDENGAYTILFAHEGQQVELKCKDRAVVNDIDSKNDNFAEMGLLLDEEGYIVKKVDAGDAMIGVLGCNNYNIIELDGNTFTAERWLEGSNTGDQYTATVGSECDIFLVENGCEAEFVGQRVESLKMGDRLTCYTDLEGNPKVIFIIRRLADSAMYYSMERKYANNETTRTPEGGYYTFEMVGPNGVFTARTADKDIATRMDSYTSQCMGLKLNGNIIEEVYDSGCVCGAWAAGEKRYVTASSGTVVTLTAWANFNTMGNYVVRPDCKIYDVSGAYGVPLGKEVTPQLLDRVTFFQNIAGEITHGFVLEHHAPNAKIYYNIERLYRSATKETARIPDEEGYYIFQMCCEGKEVTIKTKSKSMATFIDKQNAPFVALDVSGGIARNAYPMAWAVPYGYKELNTNYIGEIKSDGTIRAYYIHEGQKKYRTNDYKMAENCIVYNVSPNFIKNRGEKTTLRVGDRIQAIATNPKGEIVQIYVMTRKLNAPLYWKVDQKYNATKKETTREPNAEGYYVFDIAVNGEIKQFKTNSKEIASQVDSYTQAFTMRTDGDIILNVYSVTVAKNVKDVYGNYDVMALSADGVRLQRNYPVASNYGDVKEVKFAKDCVYYDVSAYADPFGAKATLEVGDRICAYINDDNEISYCYITYKNTRKAGHISKCEHCGEEVFWEPFAGNILKSDTHYYLTHDFYREKQLGVGSEDKSIDNDVVIDLNGKTLTFEKRGFLVYSKLSIMDSAGGGKLEAKNADGSMGGVLMALGDAEVNVYSGTITPTADAIPASNAGLMFISGGATLNIYGGTLTGGKVVGSYGGNLYINKDSTLNIYGGTVSDGAITGEKDSHGGNIYMVGATFNYAGGTISGGSAKFGGNLYAGIFKDAECTVNMTGGVIENGTAVIRGGNIYLGGSKDAGNVDFSMTGGQILGGVSQGTSGGSIYATRANMTINSTVSGGKFATEGENTGANINCVTSNLVLGEKAVITAEPQSNARFGGNIAASGDGSITVNGAQITGGVAAHRGGNFYIAGQTNLTVNSGVITGGVAADRGGNIFSNAAGTTITVNGGKIQNGDAKGSFGGNILLASALTLKVNGGELSGGTAKTNGGNICVAGVAGEVLISGGKVTGGSIMLVGPDAQNPAKCAISGGTVGGTVSVTTLGKVTVSGKPVVSELKINEGSKIVLGELTQGAKITVSAKGVFTEANENAASYKDYFLPAREGDSIAVVDNALSYEKFLRPANDPLVFDPGTTDAECSICGEKVTWKALTGDATITFQNGDHYYLAEDVTYNGTTDAFLTAPGTDKEACLHLNEHNITATAHRVVMGSTGTLNIMGNGVVSGNYESTERDYSATVRINTSGASGTINLFGGTYVKAAGNKQNTVVGIWHNGGKISMYEGATVRAAAGENAVYIGTSNLVNSIFTVYGGNVEGGRIYVAGANAEKGNISSLLLSGGTVSGGVEVKENSTVVLANEPVISDPGMKLAEGVKLLLGELKQNASIVISAKGVFTEENTNIANYKDCFIPVGEGDTIDVVGNALRYTAYVPKLNDNLRFAAGSNVAACPICKDNVEWTAITQATHGTAGIGNATSGAHYYLSEDITYSAAEKFVQAPGTNGTACLHLNGHNLTAQNATVIQGYAGTINVLGNGIVSGNNAYANYGAAVHINTGGSKGTVNLYGGTYTKPESNTNASVIAIWNNGGIIKIFEEATVRAAGSKHSVYVGTSNMVNSDLTLAGTVEGSVYCAGANPQNGKTSTITISGTTGAVEMAANNAVILTGKPVMEKLTLAAGVMVNPEQMDTSATVMLSANGAFTQAFSKAADYAGCFKPVNPAAKIQVVNNMLYCQKDYVSNLSFTEGTKAICPACEKEVQWTVLTADAAVTLENGDHYYLANDVTFEASADTFLTAPGVGGTACLHLNGNNLAAKNSRAILGNAGVLNIMGSGNVSGNFTGASQHRGTALDTGNGGTTGQLNLYGGTYKAESANTTNNLVTAWNGGSINVYDGALIDNGERSNDNVKIFYGVLNMYGGKICGGTGRQVMTTNYTETKVGNFNMYSGEIVGNLGLFGSSQTKGTVTISGGTITGDVNVSATCAATVSGAPVINKLVIASGTKITLGKLEANASILVSGSGVFTEVSPDAQAYLDAQYIKASDASKTITVEGGALSIA